MVHMACKHKHMYMYMYILDSLKLMRYLLTMQHFGSWKKMLTVFEKLWIEIQDWLQHLLYSRKNFALCKGYMFFVVVLFVRLFILFLLFLEGWGWEKGGKLKLYMYTIIMAMLDEEKSPVVFSQNLTIIKL